MIGTDNRPFQEGPDALNGVRVDFAAHPFFGGVVDGLMAGVLVSDAVVRCPIVGEVGFGLVCRELLNKAVQTLPVSPMHQFENNLPTTLDSTDHDGFVAFVPASLTLSLATDKGLVDFDDAFEGHGVGVSHGGPDTMAEIPRRPISNGQRSLKLECGDALLGFYHEIDGQHPLSERQVGVMKHGACRNRERVAA